MRPYIGIVAEIAELRPLVEVVLDQYCYGQSRHPFTAQEMITAFGIPSEIALEAETKIRTVILRQVQMAFGVIYPSCRYHYQWRYDKTLQMSESESVPIEPPVDPDECSETVEVENDHDPEVLKESLERGDWVPERLRRMLF